jgi:hypothetical protein
MLRIAPLLCCLLISQAALAQVEPAPAEVDLVPAEPAPLGVGSLFVGITSLLGGWRYWHGDRYVLISTVPADAEVGLYYIRFNFQKRFERARTPVRVRLPKRANTTGRDVFFVRVVANGFTTEERSYPARKVSGELLIQLAPLPNDLVFFGHTYLAGRTTLLLHTSEEPQFRVSQSRASPGFVLALAKTADKLERRPEVSAGQVQGVDVAQLGEDILISIATRDTEVEVRSKQSYNPIREEYILLLDIMSRGARVPAPADVRRALDRLAYAPADRCNRSAEAALRDGLDPVAVAKAFRPTGSIADVYRREAMLHLGRLDRGTVHTLVGEDLRTGNPIELQLALQTPVTVEGYLGLLEVFALSQDEPSSVLRSLLAPEMSPEDFRPIAAAAEAARKACRN